MQQDNRIMIFRHELYRLRMVLFICAVFFAGPVSGFPESGRPPPCIGKAGQTICTLRVGLYENAPKIFTDEDGNASGFWPAVVRHIAGKEGWRVQWVPGTWDMCLERLSENRIDMMPDMAWTEERRKKFALSRETVLLSWSRLYVKKGEEIASIPDLQGKRIAVLSKSVNVEGPEGIKEITGAFEIDCTYIEKESYADVLAAVDSGEADAGVTNRDFGNRREDRYDIERTPLVFQPVRLVFAFPKAASFSSGLVLKIDDHIRMLKENKNSAYYDALDEWIGRPPAGKTIPVWVKRLGIIAIGVCVLLIAGNIILRSRVRSRTRTLEREIESRKEAEELERRARGDWHQVFEAVGHATLILNDRHEILLANRAALGATGMSAEEITGKKCYRLFHRLDAPPPGCPLQRTLQSGILETNEMEVETLNGTFLVSCTPLYNEAGQTDKIIHIATDITRRKEAEKRLRASEKQFRSMLETIELIGIMIDTNGDIIFCNDYFLSLTGMHREEVTGKNWFDTFIPDDIRKHLNINVFRKTIETGVFPAHLENEIILGSGERRMVKWNNTVFKDDGGNVVSVTSIGEDITDLISSRAALQKAKERFQELVESVNDVVFSMDGEGTVTYISPRIESLSGFSPDEIMGRRFDEFIAGPDIESVEQYFENHKRGTGKPMEFRLRTKSGEHRWVRSSSRPVFKNGVFSGLRGILSDISEAMEMDNKLRQAQKMESVGNLAGGIAHDFNNILTSIIGYATLALTEAEKGTELHKDLSEVLAAGDRARELTRQILNISRHEAHQKEILRIGPMIKEALKMLRATMPTSIQIHEKISRDLLVVSADPTQIHQVIMNLATNALHAMADREGVMEIGLDALTVSGEEAMNYPDIAAGEYARITVSDTGDGIPEENLDKIFEPYFTTKEKETGTGLGLSVVHGIIKAHNGHITVYSEPGKGTAFHVYLPLARKTAAEKPAAEEKPLPRGTEHILLVDDESKIVKVYRRQLEKLGYRVTGKEGSREALESFRAAPGKFDLIVTDMTMPDITGDKLAHAVKEIRPDMPVILCTGFSEKINGRGDDLAIDELLMKPIDSAKLAETVRNLLDRNQD